MVAGLIAESSRMDLNEVPSSLRMMLKFNRERGLEAIDEWIELNVHQLNHLEAALRKYEEAQEDLLIPEYAQARVEHRKMLTEIRDRISRTIAASEALKARYA